jgi:hypothetical protein
LEKFQNFFGFKFFFGEEEEEEEEVGGGERGVGGSGDGPKRDV